MNKLLSTEESVQAAFDYLNTCGNASKEHMKEVVPILIDIAHNGGVKSYIKKEQKRKHLDVVCLFDKFNKNY